MVFFNLHCIYIYIYIYVCVSTCLAHCARTYTHCASLLYQHEETGKRDCGSEGGSLDSRPVTGFGINAADPVWLVTRGMSQLPSEAAEQRKCFNSMSPGLHASGTCMHSAWQLNLRNSREPGYNNSPATRLAVPQIQLPGAVLGSWIWGTAGSEATTSNLPQFQQTGTVHNGATHFFAQCPWRVSASW